MCIGVSCGRGYWFGNWPCVAVTGLVHSLGGLPVVASVVIGSEGWKEAVTGFQCWPCSSVTFPR